LLDRLPKHARGTQNNTVAYTLIARISTDVPVFGVYKQASRKLTMLMSLKRNNLYFTARSDIVMAENFNSIFFYPQDSFKYNKRNCSQKHQARGP
jgi:hypothetical protein